MLPNIYVNKTKQLWKDTSAMFTRLNNGNSTHKRDMLEDHHIR